MFSTVCVDHEGFIWSFGKNKYGQLGTGNKTDFNVPQKLLDLPPVFSVSCGRGEEIQKDNYVMETRKIAQILNKHHFRTFPK